MYGRGRPKYHRKKRRLQRTLARSNGVRRKTGSVRTHGLMGPTMQIATRVQPNLKLKFVYNNTYTINPSVQKNLPNHPTGQLFWTMGFCANSIHHLYCDGNLTGQQGHFSTIPQIVQSQKQDGLAPSADGYEQWKSRYNRGYVIGSKITISAKTIAGIQGQTEPGMLFLHKTSHANVQDAFDPMKGSEQLQTKPYVCKALIMPSNVSTGATLKMGYSAKKFEGAKSIVGNDEYAISMFPYAKPKEETSFIIGYCNAKGLGVQPGVTQGSGNHYTPEIILQVKVEYIVALAEPNTAENPPPAPVGAMLVDPQ